MSTIIFYLDRYSDIVSSSKGGAQKIGHEKLATREQRSSGHEAA
jgi:hypothetical protein